EYVVVNIGEAVQTSPLLSDVCLLKHPGASADTQDTSAPYFNSLRESHVAYRRFSHGCCREPDMGAVWRHTATCAARSRRHRANGVWRGTRRRQSRLAGVGRGS